MPILQPVGTSLVEEVDVFNEQAEERDDDLQDSRKRKGVISRRQCGGGFPCDSQMCVCGLYTQIQREGITTDKEDLLIFISWENRPSFLLIVNMVSLSTRFQFLQACSSLY